MSHKIEDPEWELVKPVEKEIKKADGDDDD